MAQKYDAGVPLNGQEPIKEEVFKDEPSEESLNNDIERGGVTPLPPPILPEEEEDSKPPALPTKPPAQPPAAALKPPPPTAPGSKPPPPTAPGSKPPPPPVGNAAKPKPTAPLGSPAPNPAAASKSPPRATKPGAQAMPGNQPPHGKSPLMHTGPKPGAHALSGATPPKGAVLKTDPGQGPPRRPLPPGQRPPPKKKREKNKHFQDVDNTGTWGEMSRKELYIVIAIVIAVIGAVVAVVVVFTSGKSGGNGDASSDGVSRGTAPNVPGTPPPTMAPTVQVDVPPDLQLTALLSQINASDFVNMTQLPNDVDFYVGLSTDKTQPPAVRAMSWILHEDPADLFPNNTFLYDRFALALIYYGTNGENWIDQSNWLTRAHACSWYGVFCNRFNTTIQELDFNNNNLTGTLPEEINLFQSINSLVLSSNGLKGELPQLAIGTLPRLTILFVDNNQFTGRLSTNLRRNGVLGTLMVQRNNLTGSFPRSFCQRNNGPEIFTQLGLDCDEISCRCCEPNNCF